MTEARNRALALRANFEVAGAVVVEPLFYSQLRRY